MPYETLKRDMLITYCKQSAFMGYHPQVRMRHWFSVMGTVLPFEIIIYAI
jgi:hypothetical protein